MLKKLIIAAIFLVSTKGAIAHAAEDPCLVFTCMAGKLQGNDATSGADCVAGRESFFDKRVYDEDGYDPEATSELRRTFLNTCTSIGVNMPTLESIIQRYGRSFDE